MPEMKATRDGFGEALDLRVINMHTIKPIDQETVIKAARETGAVVTAEEHQINGGLGGAIAEVLGRNFPVPIEMVAVNDTFGESGEPEELLKKYHLKNIDIIDAVKKVLQRKNLFQTRIGICERRGDNHVKNTD